MSSSTTIQSSSSRRRRIGIIALLAVIGAFMAAFVVPATAPVGSSAAPPTASAKVGGVRVNVVSGGSLRIYCDYGSSAYETLTNGQNSQQSGKCTDENNDTDQLRDNDSKRCMYVSGVKPGRNGWWIVPAATRIKIHDVATYGVHSYGSKCSSKKVWPDR